MDKSLFDSELKSLESFILNSAPDISYSNFIFAILISAFLAFIVKLTYIKISRTLNDREYFSDTFIPLAIVTTLVITVVKFSLALCPKDEIKTASFVMRDSSVSLIACGCSKISFCMK